MEQGVALSEGIKKSCWPKFLSFSCIGFILLRVTKETYTLRACSFLAGMNRRPMGGIRFNHGALLQAR
jgi:hypothetical protein